MKKMVLFLVFIAFSGGCRVSDSSIYDKECEEIYKEECSQEYINCVAYAYMKDWYLWYESIPEIDVAEYETLPDMVRALRYQEKDQLVDRFSYATKKVDHDNYYAGKRYGMGTSWKRDDDGNIFVTMVYPGSPADIAGLKRGQQIVSVNGFTVEELDENAVYNRENAGEEGFEKKTDWSNVYDAENEGEPVEFVLLEQGEEITTTVYLGDYDMLSVLKTTIIDNNGRKTGYVHLKAFISPSEDELNKAFEDFKKEKIEELVLDLRYNGGGLVRISEQLINLIAGKSVDGEKIIKILYNDKRSDNNKHYSGKVLENSLDLKRVAIVTTRGTASASEMVINSLEPFVAVAVIGATTYGKPVGMNAKSICDQTVVPITFKNANALDYGDYYFGIEADCVSEDDFKRDFGDVEEASLKEALYYLENGKCSAPSEILRTLKKPAKFPEELIPFELEGMNRIDYTF
jgi:carboxyl-terminal processing protease